MWRARLTLILLLVICFSLAVWLQPRLDAHFNRHQSNESVLATLLGDGRKLIADYFYVEADVYFHSGYYPSVFDQARKQEETDSDVSNPEEGGGKQEEKGFMGKPLDWIDAFSRHFRPSRHTHLHGQAVQEILPWMKLSADLDPHRVQTYIVTAYWLRRGLGESAEAESCIRDGLRSNPHSPDLLYVLADIYLEDRKDYPRAKKLFLAALRCWHEVEESKPVKTETGEGERNYLLLEQIYGGLVREEMAAGHLDQALAYMKTLRANATDPKKVQQQIDELQARINAEAGKTNSPPSQ
jgi:tetratricopeptide (TPR) repeat protein